MKVKTLSKKLVLKKSIVANLNNIDLNDVKGGGDTRMRFNGCQGTVNATICYSDCNNQVCLGSPSKTLAIPTWNVNCFDY